MILPLDAIHTRSVNAEVVATAWKLVGIHYNASIAFDVKNEEPALNQNHEIRMILYPTASAIPLIVNMTNHRGTF